MAGPNPNKQAVELNRTSLYWGLLLIFSSRILSQQNSSINTSKLWDIIPNFINIYTTRVPGPRPVPPWALSLPRALMSYMPSCGLLPRKVRGARQNGSATP